MMTGDMVGEDLELTQDELQAVSGGFLTATWGLQSDATTSLNTATQTLMSDYNQAQAMLGSLTSKSHHHSVLIAKI